MSFDRAADDLWLAMLMTWFLASFWVARAKTRGSFRLSILHLLGFWLGFALLFTPPLGRGLLGQPYALAGVFADPWRTPLWAVPLALGWLLVAAEAAAFAFAWWARVHIGALWSGYMIVRENHRIVDTGPYGLVRHPIYTGFIGGAWALALVSATPVALAGAVVLTVVMATKAGQEEAFLRRELGAAGYDAYAARTPMLVPFARR